MLSTSTSVLDSLIEIFGIMFILLLALVVFSSLASLTRQLSLNLFSHPSWLQRGRPMVSRDTQSQTSCSTLNLLVALDFCLFGFFEDINGLEVFLCFCPDILFKFFSFFLFFCVFPASNVFSQSLFSI